MIDPLLQGIKTAFSAIKGHRYKNKQIQLSDYLQSGFAMFHLKDPSLHHYRINYPEREANLEQIYQIKSLPSDSAMRLSLSKYQQPACQTQSGRISNLPAKRSQAGLANPQTTILSYFYLTKLFC